MFLFFFAKELKPIHKVKWQNFPPVWLFGTLQLLENAVISCCNSRNLSSAFRADTHTGRHRKHTQWHRACITWGLGPSLYTPLFPKTLTDLPLYTLSTSLMFTTPKSFLNLTLTSWVPPPASPNPRNPAHPLWDHIPDGATLLSVSCLSIASGLYFLLAAGMAFTNLLLWAHSFLLRGIWIGHRNFRMSDNPSKPFYL